MQEEDLSQYRTQYSERGLWGVLKKHARQLGVKSVYSILLFYYAFRRNETPRWAKNIIIGVLGYLISPIDALPDLTPIIGYTDDLGLLSFGLVAIAAYINEEVRQQARAKLREWFTMFDENALQEVDKRL